MQLHAFLLVFLFITDKAVAILHCGGNVPLDQEPAGHINLFPGLFNHTSRLNNMSQQSDEGLLLSNCTWMLGIPLRRKILLKLKWFERDSRILLRCVDEDQILQHNGTTVLLSGCHENKAVLSWTGPGISSNSIQLTYIVQELEGNSSDQPTHQQVQYPTDWSKTGATHKRSAKGGQEVEKSTKDRGHVYEEQMWSFGTPSMSSAVSQDEELQPPTSSQWGLPFAGRTDRETLSLPEEKWNNGADTSGAAHLTEKRIVAITHPNFQLPVSIDSKSQTENCTGLPQGQTETSQTDAKASLSANTDLQISASQMLTNTKKLFTRMDELAAIQTNPTASSFSVLNTSFTGILTSDGKTPVDPHGGAIGQTLEDNQAGSDRFYSAVTSIIILEHLKPSIKPPQHDSNNRDPTLPSSSSPEGYRWAPSPTTHLAESPTVVDVLKSTDRPYNTDEVHTVTPSSHSQTNSLEKIERHSHFLHSLPILTQTNGMETQTATEAVQRSETNFDVTTNMIQTLFKKDGSPFTNRHAQMTKIQNSSPAPAITETYAPPISQTLMSPIDSPTPLYVLQTKTGIPDGSEIASTSSLAKSSMDMNTMEPKSTAQSSQTSHLLLPSTATVFPIKHFSSTASSPLPPVKSDSGDIRRTTSRQWLPSSTKPNPTAGPSQAFYPSQQNQYGGTSLELTPKPKGSSTKSPLYYIVPNHPATIRVELVELLLQLIIEDYPSAVIAGQEDDIKAWLETCLQKAPGFNKLLDIWSSGHVVQSLVEFKTSEALQWLSINSSLLLEQTGLVQAVHQGKMFRSSRITNITVGGQQGDVCDWLLQCPSGYKCVPQPGTSNYSCSSTCHFDYCHHHGICTHHPAQLPVCRCLVGDDFWYMGQRCDIKMTQARLIGACLAVMLIIMMAIGILAFLAVRRYRSILIQAKVDQTRSSYRKFNHFDELSGRFWLRSWAESADSLDNPAFMRSDELLHLRALDRPCCYHDDTLSLPSTSASHGTRINTIYPHSSQYGWRGSGMSMGDCVLDSGKASDLSVCSWPVEPIHWTPFPLLQQLASHRNPAVPMSRPRSYCEGMELVDLGKSWTA